MEFDGIGKEPPQFSPDSRHLAFIADRNGKQMIVVDGMATQPYDFLRRLHFDSSSHLRAIGSRTDESFTKVLVGVEIQILEE